jgi:hypothetical protein
LSVEFGQFEQGIGLEQQRRLFDDAFPEHEGRGASSVEHYRWKFHSAPGDPHSYEYEAREAGEMLGYYAAIPYPYCVGGHAMSVGMVCDVMTSSSARGRGIFTRLGEYSLSRMQESELAFVTGYPIRPDVMGGHLRVGWKVAFELPMYLRPLRSNAILASRHLGALAPIVNVGLRGVDALLSRRRGADRYSVETGSSGELLCGPELSAFLEGWSGSVKNHLLKTPDFYDWRLGAPGTSYEVFRVHRAGAVVALAIGRVTTLQGIPSLALLDLMVLDGEQEALPVLFSEIERAARAAGAEAVVTMMSRYQAARHRLRRVGFLRSPFVFKLIVRSVSESLDIDSISAETDWHLMWIDSDDL